jgi:hypothetical protein
MYQASCPELDDHLERIGADLTVNEIRAVGKMFDVPRNYFQRRS